MPHHWKPFDPGNPDCQTVVDELRERYGDKLKYVGFDGERCWALYETGRAEEDEEAQERDPCERQLEDAYEKGKPKPINQA
jgi:hypothetical protein